MSVGGRNVTAARPPAATQLSSRVDRIDTPDSRLKYQVHGLCYYESILEHGLITFIYFILYLKSRNYRSVHDLCNQQHWAELELIIFNKLREFPSKGVKAT